jgi:predicted anti-sigma-YlaC factor YlaD
MEGALSPEEQARFDDHVVRCEACRGFRRQMSSIVAILGTLRAQSRW